jgi:excisionase family DNA binding protein
MKLKEMKDRNKEFFSVKDIASLLDLSPVTITRWCKSGFIPAIKVGQQWRISASEFEAWLKQQKEEAQK